MTFDKEQARKTIRDNYASIAKGEVSGCCSCGPGCCGSGQSSGEGAELARKLGYSADDLQVVPEAANMGLSCGNPFAEQLLQVGQTVLDLGCGAGFDCFIARRFVGESGRVIGVDMTPEMVALGRENAAKLGYENVEFRLGEIENLPVADESVDVIISNCVINLSLDKQRVFREAFRVLRTGGRLSIADVVATGSIPEEIRRDPKMLSGCVAGAASVDEMRTMLEEAGFTNIEMEPVEKSTEILGSWSDRDIGSFVASFIIRAEKPSA